MAERKQNGKKETKHVNNAESKNQKNKLKVGQKKQGDNIPWQVYGCGNSKTQKSKQNILKAGDGWDEDGPERASESHVGEHTLDMWTESHILLEWRSTNLLARSFHNNNNNKKKTLYRK